MIKDAFEGKAHKLKKDDGIDFSKFFLHEEKKGKSELI
jgi:hypothetical protein